MSGQSGDHRDRKSYQITAAVKSDLCAGWEGWSGRVGGGGVKTSWSVQL